MYMHYLHALARKSKEAYIHTYVNIYMLIRPQCQTIALSGLEFVGVSRVNVEYWLHECFTSMRV